MTPAAKACGSHGRQGQRHELAGSVSGLRGRERPDRGGQPHQLPSGHLGPAADIGVELGQRLLRAGQSPAEMLLFPGRLAVR
jgi:hypothetical protein